MFTDDADSSSWGENGGGNDFWYFVGLLRSMFGFGTL